MRYRVLFSSRQDFKKSMLLFSLVPAAAAMVLGGYAGKLISGDSAMLVGGGIVVAVYMYMLAKTNMLDFDT